MTRSLPRRARTHARQAALLALAAAAHAEPVAIAPKAVIEFPLPGAGETHELIATGGGRVILVTQITDSSVVKVHRDPATGRILGAARFLIGNEHDGLHGLGGSTRYPGKVWATQQFASRLLLLEPRADQPDVSPVVERSLDVPAPGRGPHVIREIDGMVWASLKDSNHLLRMNPEDPEDFTLFPTSRKPIFMAKHSNGRIYASQDQSSKILSLDPATGRSFEIDVPRARGTTPVGLITGPDGNVWFTLAGAQGGTGTFAKIDAGGELRWFQLTCPQGKAAGLLHLAFEPPTEGELPRLHLLGSSIADADGPDGVFSVRLDAGYERILTQVSTLFPTQASKLHRVIVLGRDLFVTELATSAIARVPLASFHQRVDLDEDSDPYATFGLGTRANQLRYPSPAPTP